MRTYINILCVSVLLSLSMSCTDEILDEIDTNPNQVNDAPLNTLFPQTTMGFIRGVAGSGSVRLTSFIAEHHTNVLGMGGIYNTMTSYNSAAWNSGYSTLNDLKILRLKAQESQAWAYAGIADILSAYTYSNLVDIYGEIPFSEALQAGEIRQPKFDQVQDVYQGIQMLLDAGISNLDRASEGIIPSKDDLVFHGNMDLWRKTAYALKIRLFNRLSNIDPIVSANDALSAMDDSFTNPDENFVFTQYTENRNHENPFSGAQHSQPEFAMGNGIYRAMSWFSLNNNIEDDPRANIWFSRINGEIIPAPNGIAGGDFGEPRLDGRFYSKPTVLKFQDSPQPVATFVELKYIEAEANLRLGNLQEANDAYKEAVVLSLQRAAWFNPSVSLAEEQIRTYIEKTTVFPEPNKLTLEHILLQKYIYLFYNQPLEAYNDIRREKFMPISDPNGLPNVIPYPDSEISRNSNVPKNVNLTTIFNDITKLYWAK